MRRAIDTFAYWIALASAIVFVAIRNAILASALLCGFVLAPLFVPGMFLGK